MSAPFSLCLCVGRLGKENCGFKQQTREHLLTGMDENQGFHVHYGCFLGKMVNSVTADWEMVLLGE